MATITGKTLSTAYQGSLPVYAVTRLLADGRAFNGATLEAFDATHLATYAIGLTARGGDLYTQDVPDALPAGVYQFYFYEQAGSAVAADDLILGAPVYAWSGSAATDPGGDPPAPSQYALTTLANVKMLMGITDNSQDARLVYLIDSVSSLIETIINRQILARDFRTRLNGVGQRRLVLPNYPVQSVTRIAYGNATAFTVGYTSTAIRATASVYLDPETGDAGGLLLNSVSSTGIPTTTKLTFAACPSTALLVAAVNAVAGWRGNLFVNWPSADLFPVVLNNCIGTTADVTYPDFDCSSYVVDNRTGIVTFDDRWNWPQWRGGYASALSGGPFRRQATAMPGGQQAITVQYRAGYETIPADLSLIAADAVKDAANSTGRDGTVKSRSLGPASWSFDTGRADAFLRDRLSPWISAASMVGSN